MKDRRVAILDASLPLTSPSRRERGKPTTASSLTKSKASKQTDREKDKSAAKSDVSADKPISAPPIGVLLPIPGFAVLMKEAGREALNALPSSRQPSAKMEVVYLDHGLICSVDAVELFALRIHSRVLKSLAPTTL